MPNPFKSPDTNGQDQPTAARPWYAVRYARRAAIVTFVLVVIVGILELAFFGYHVVSWSRELGKTLSQSLHDVMEIASERNSLEDWIFALIGMPLVVAFIAGLLGLIRDVLSGRLRRNST